MPGQSRHYPVRWWYCGYHDGYHRTQRDDGYFQKASEPEITAYRKGFERGAGERNRHDRHDRLMTVARYERA
jgi:hypothetical protein